MATDEEGESNESSDESRYGDELLRANWNPVVDLLQWSVDCTASFVRPPANGPVTDEEAEAFLRRIYSAGA